MFLLESYISLSMIHELNWAVPIKSEQYQFYWPQCISSIDDVSCENTIKYL